MLKTLKPKTNDLDWKTKDFLALLECSQSFPEECISVETRCYLLLASVCYFSFCETNFHILKQKIF